MKNLILLALINLSLLCNAQSLEYHSAVSTFKVGSGDSGSGYGSESWDANPRMGTKIVEINSLPRRSARISYLEI